MRRITFSRVRQFTADWFSCWRMMGNPFDAYGFLRAGRAPELGNFRVAKMLLAARKEDWPAVREVIVEDEYACIDKLFAPGEAPRILDLGANIGTFAMRVLSRCPAAKVASVEPASDTYEVLHLNKQRNPEYDWQIFNVGVWGRDASLTLERRGISLGHRVIEGIGEEAIEGVSLPSLLSRLGWDRANLIKIDIEGGEESVVPAARDVLSNVDALIIEVHSDRIDAAVVMHTLDELFTFKLQLNSTGSSKQVYLMTKQALITKSSI